MMNTDAGESQTWTHIMYHLVKGYTQKDIKSGTTRIDEEKHLNKQADWTMKVNIMNTNHTLSNISTAGKYKDDTKVVYYESIKILVVYYESIKWELKIRPIYECRCDERQQTVVLFIITEKGRGKERKWDGVGVMKDKEMKLEDVKVPHTLGWASSIIFEYIDPVEVRADSSLAEVELSCLLWIDKVRAT